MGLADLWNRTLVYFGIAEEYDESWEDGYVSDDDVDTPYVEQVYPERSSANVRRLTPRRRGDAEIDYDDWTVAQPRAAEAAAQGASPRSRPRPVQAVPGAPVQVHLVLPRSFNDAQQIADKFKSAMPVIVNLQSADHELSKRLIDFASGLTYALNGTMQRVADKVFLLTPSNVEVSAEERVRALERGGFFNQA